jgi:hypothetical protein
MPLPLPVVEAEFEVEAWRRGWRFTSRAYSRDSQMGGSARNLEYLLATSCACSDGAVMPFLYLLWRTIYLE